MAAPIVSPSAPAAAPLAQDAPVKRDRTPKAAKALPAQRHGRYAMAWGAVGLIAGAYVVTVLINQDAVTGLATNRTDAPVRDVAENSANIVKTQAEVASLQRTVGSLESDMAKLKAGATHMDARELELTNRVAAVEGRLDQFTTTLTQFIPGARVAAKQPPATPPQPVAAAPTPAAPAQRVAAAAPAAMPTSAANIKTGALPTQDSAAVPRELAAARHSAPVGSETAAASSAAVLLARGPSLDALRLSWSLLNERHKGALKTLEPRVVEIEPGSYQLLAGPISNPAEALKVCATLKARGVACQAADFRGDAL